MTSANWDTEKEKWRSQSLTNCSGQKIDLEGLKHSSNLLCIDWLLSQEASPADKDKYSLCMYSRQWVCSTTTEYKTDILLKVV